MASYTNQSFIKNFQTLDGKFLDVNKLPSISSSPYDEDYIIPQKYHERPDLLAYQLYESSRLWWVFAMRNLDEIRDPIRDFKAGTRIKLPSESTVLRFRGT
ncbi:hypothetical protein N9N08_00825 [bacterium]|jgi:hypothetical protein|nr:hypothetical protein [bacterium]